MARELFALIPEAHIRGMLEALHECSELPLQLINARGEVLLRFGELSHYCTLVKKHFFTHNECAVLHRKAGERAQMLGEAYIFTCHSGLTHIAFPLLNQGELLGTIIIGPFLMDQPDSTLLGGLLEQPAITPALALELYDELTGLRVVAPKRVTHLSTLVGHLFAPLLVNERAALLAAREKLAQQSRINETIQMYKEQSAPVARNYFYEKETTLLTKVKTGNLSEAKALLNDLLGYVLFSEGGRVEAVRMRAIELTTLLSRVSMEGGARADSVYELNSRFLSLMSREQDFESICQLLQEVVESFIGAMFSTTDGGNAHIRHALRYMTSHYTQPLTLPAVAAAVGLSANYFSTLFRQIVGESFRKHLMRIRVEESKQLLLSTDDSLTDIAVSMGFSDQSYYCRVFRDFVGMTPGKFRA